MKTFLLLSTVAGMALASPAFGQMMPAGGGALMISENFESGALNTNLWDVRQSGTTTVTIVQDKVAHGKNALKIHYPAGASRAWGFVAAKLPPGLHDHLYGRAYVYLSGVPKWNHNVYLSAGTPGWPISNFLEVGDDTGQFKSSFQQNGAGVPRGETVAKQGEVPMDRWFCLEWEFTDKPTDRIVVTVDGKQVSDKAFSFKGADTELVKGFSEVDLGFRSWARPMIVTNDVDVYYDDIAISDKPIGQIKTP